MHKNDAKKTEHRFFSTRTWGTLGVVFGVVACARGTDTAGYQAVAPQEDAGPYSSQTTAPSDGAVPPNDAASPRPEDAGFAPGAKDAGGRPDDDASVPAPSSKDASVDSGTADGSDGSPASAVDGGGTSSTCVKVPGGPCGLAPQCGCAANETCSVRTQAGAVACIAAGQVASGGACSTSQDCAAGLDCIANVCRAYCATAGADCPTAGKCMEYVTSQGTPIPNMKACSIPCDLAKATSCGPNAGCVYTGASGTDCSAVGTAGLGEDCTNNEDCVAGAACVDGYCSKWCRLPAILYPNDCASTFATCMALNRDVTVGGTRYGACL